MKKIIPFLFLCAPSFAADVTLDFRDIGIQEFARVVLTDIQKKPFVFDDSFKTSQAQISINATVDRSVVGSVLDAQLKDAGYVLDRGPVWRIRKDDNGRETYFYEPKHRSVAYLAQRISSRFKATQFDFSANGATQPPTQSTVNSVSGYPNVVNSPVTSGVSAPIAENFIFTGYHDEVEQLKAILEKIDTKEKEVSIQAALYEVSNVKKESSAISVIGTILKGKLGLSLGAVSAANPMTAVLKLGGLQAVLQALDTDTRLHSLSRPQLRVVSGGEGKVQVGDETPILGAIRTENNGAQTQSVEYRPSGVIFNVKPVVRSDTVNMAVSVESSSFVQTTTGVNQSPTLLKRAINTTVSAEPGHLILLGGLQSQKRTSDKLVFSPFGLPVSNTSDDGETELVLLLYIESI